MGNGCRIARVRSKVDGRTYPIYYVQHDGMASVHMVEAPTRGRTSSTVDCMIDGSTLDCNGNYTLHSAVVKMGSVTIAGIYSYEITVEGIEVALLSGDKYMLHGCRYKRLVGEDGYGQGD